MDADTETAAPVEEATETTESPPPPSEPSPTKGEPSAPKATEKASGRSDASPAPGDEESFWERLSEYDPDELVRRHPKLQGKLGALAQKQAQKEATALAQKIAADLVARQRAEEELQRQRELAASGDLYSLGAIKKKEVLDLDAQSKSEKERAKLFEDFWRGSADPILLFAAEELLEEPLREPILDKHRKGGYGADPIEARKAYLSEVLEAHANAKVAAARKRWETVELPAKIEEQLGVAASAEESLDKESGSTSATGEMTREEYERLKNDYDTLTRPENWKRFEAGRRAGLI